MSMTLIFDLEHNRKRLSYYSQLKERTVVQAGAKAKAGKAIDKWLEIYAERVQKLEKQASKLGLKKELSAQIH